MTEEEKKEFEEFLKWKAEKAKGENTSEQTNEPESAQEQNPQLLNAPKELTKSDGDVKKEDGNKIFLIICIAFISIFLLFLLLVLSGKKQNHTQPDSGVDLVDDTVEVDVAVPDYSAEPIKKEWDFVINKDEMTDSKNIWASITSDNYVTQDFPYEGQTRATIVVRYMKKYGYDVIIQISKGQINGRDYYGTNYISARFDENKPKKYYFNESADGDSKVVFLRKSSDFIKNCKKAKDIKIDLPLYKGGRPLFTFHVDEPLVWKEDY